MHFVKLPLSIHFACLSVIPKRNAGNEFFSVVILDRRLRLFCEVPYTNGHPVYNWLGSSVCQKCVKIQVLDLEHMFLINIFLICDHLTSSLLITVNFFIHIILLRIFRCCHSCYFRNGQRLWPVEKLTSTTPPAKGSGSSTANLFILVLVFFPRIFR